MKRPGYVTYVGPNVSGDGQSRHESDGQECKTDRSTLKHSSLASVKVKGWEIAVGQALKVPSPDSTLKPRSLASTTVNDRKISVGQGLIVQSLDILFTACFVEKQRYFIQPQLR